MTATAVDINVFERGQAVVSRPVAAAEQIYLGTLVCRVRASGYLADGDNLATLEFEGVADQGCNNLLGAAGAENCLVKREGVFRFASSGMAITDIGAEVYLADNKTVTKTPGYVRVGIVEEYVSATEVWVRIQPGFKGALFSIPVFRAGVVGASAVTVRSALKSTKALRVRCGFADARVAPGGAYTCTVTLTNGTTPVTFTITGSATHGENEAIDQVYPAGSDFSVTMVDSNASAITEDINAQFVAQEL